MGFQLQFTVQLQGVCFSLLSSGTWGGFKPVQYEKWQTIKTPYRGSIGILIRLCEENSGKVQNDTLILSHEVIANLSQSEAFLLRLPPITPLHITLKSNGNISQDNFSIDMGWLTPQGVRAAGLCRTGSMLSYQGKWQRLPQTLYNLCEAIEIHNGLLPEQKDEKRKYLALITDALPVEAQKQITKDTFLSSLRVYHAAALSLHLATSEGGLDFTPLLFGQSTSVKQDIASEGTETITEGYSLLPPKYQSSFIRHFTQTYPVTRASYVLGDNRFVFLEPMLQDCLEVVRKMRSANDEVKRQFIRTPQRFFKEELATKYADEALETIFVPTQEYSERVIGIGVWVKKILPWTVPSGNQWVPEYYGVCADDFKVIFADKDSVTVAKKLVQEAINNGLESIEIKGTEPEQTQELQNLSDVEQLVHTLEVPATESTLQILESIEKLLEPYDAHDKKSTVDTVGKEETVNCNGPIFLGTKDNDEQVKYDRFRPRKSIPLDIIVPKELKSELKLHQTEAWHWLADLWSNGYNGALLADDMGLGKTLTCLTFLLWIRQRIEQLALTPKPILIVAPTSLVGNWLKEIETHLHELALGNCIVVRGEVLNTLRQNDQIKGRDIDDGSSRLDITRLQGSQCILTTYETLRDYHHSFAALPLSIIVYDEMQKAKNYTSQISQAIRTLNAEFHLGLTGTPVENSLLDIWSIMDILLPGFLGELRQFNSTYGQGDESQLRQLKGLLEGEEENSFKPMLRRMKSDTLKGLPAKHEHTHKHFMPAIQAQAYEDALHKKMAPLELLHALRMISLHPVMPSICAESDYYNASARFKVTLELLDKIHKKKEKVLIFLESLEHQPYLAVLLQERYMLARLPRIINGKTPASLRQKYVQEFQESAHNFDVIILSPKAAGIGLTLTAANHVIHLSRWWNPAVEDQCTDRVYRIGQERVVHVYYPLAVHPMPHLAESSFDLQLHNLLERKRSLSRDLLLPQQTGKETEELYDRVSRQGLSPLVIEERNEA